MNTFNVNRCCAILINRFVSPFLDFTKKNSGVLVDAPLLAVTYVSPHKLAIVNGWFSNKETPGKRRKTCWPGLQVISLKAGMVIFSICPSMSWIVAVEPFHLGVLSLRNKRLKLEIREMARVAKRYIQVSILLAVCQNIKMM